MTTCTFTITAEQHQQLIGALDRALESCVTDHERGDKAANTDCLRIEALLHALAVAGAEPDMEKAEENAYGMRQGGRGRFAAHLGEAYSYADGPNSRTLIAAFPHLFLA